MKEFRFAYPYLWLAIPFLILLAYLLRGWLQRRNSLLFPQLQPLVNAPASWRLRFARWLPQGLRWLALLFGLAALARPQDVEYRQWTETTGIEIAISIDTSGSMQIIDMDPRGNRVVDVHHYRQGLLGPVYQIGTTPEDTWDRLDVVKAVLAQFLTKRKGDMLTITVFGDDARTLSPLTHDLQSLTGLLHQIEVGMVGHATDLHTAILYSLKRLIGLTVEDVLEMARTRSVEYILHKIRTERTSFIFDADTEKRVSAANLPKEIIAAMKAQKPRSQIMILLTDGMHTATEGEAGRREVLEAAQAAALYKVKIYTIGIGSRDAYTYVRQKREGRNNVVRIPNDSYDEALMQQISEITSGKFFSASDKDALSKVYDSINKLEPNRFKVHQWEKTRELYLWFLLPCLLLIGLELLLRETLFRRLP
jgi:Ca-activated chloride channel family protein